MCLAWYGLQKSTVVSLEATYKFALQLTHRPGTMHEWEPGVDPKLQHTRTPLLMTTTT